MKESFTDKKLKENILKFIEKHLKESRKQHTFAVRKEAIKLARLYGEDEEKAEIAALCHDLFKCFSMNEINSFIKKYGIGNKYLNNINLAHGKLAAFYAKKYLNIRDKDIINAISFHTTGRAAMSRLEKIIYLADAIEPNRTYSGVEEIREKSKEDLDEAMLMTLESSIEMLKRLGREIDSDSIKALNFMKNKEKTNY